VFGEFDTNLSQNKQMVEVYIDPFDNEESEKAKHRVFTGGHFDEELRNTNQIKSQCRLRSDLGFSRQTQTTMKNRHTEKRLTFILALIVNYEFCSLRKESRHATLDLIVVAVQRMNAISVLEIGAEFQLHSDNDKLICAEHSGPCGKLSNNLEIVDQNAGFIKENGIGNESFHIGHSIIVGDFWGEAVVGSLCNNNYKSIATTAMNGSAPDRLFVRFLLHGISHQLGAIHTNHPLNGFDSDVSSTLDKMRTKGETYGVEPGIGATIMSEYLYHEKDENTRDYFHVLSSNDIGQVFANVTGPGQNRCGIPYAKVAEIMPSLGNDSVCIIPPSTYFGVSVTPVDGNLVAFHPMSNVVDKNTRMMSGNRPEETLSIFRSYAPNHKHFRIFPSMSVIWNIIGDRGNRARPHFKYFPMWLRVTKRKIKLRITGHYLDPNNFGGPEYPYKNISVVPLPYFGFSILKKTVLRMRQWRPGTVRELHWTKMDEMFTSHNVEIFMAVQTGQTLDDGFLGFTVDTPMKSTWKHVASAPNNGSTTVSVPVFDLHSNESIVDIAIVIRGGGEGCFYFNFAINQRYKL
jgi:hypothetical protein